MPEKDGTSHTDAAELTGLARELIDREKTMTLATSGAEGPWAAPVYYLFRKGSFYFFSSPASRHVREGGGQAAASIFASGAASWQDIRGLQMSGAIEKIAPGLQAAAVIRAYLKKYPFTRDLFPRGGNIDLSAFTRTFRVNLYGFHPALVLYQDNSIRFAFREEVELRSKDPAS